MSKLHRVVRAAGGIGGSMISLNSSWRFLVRMKLDEAEVFMYSWIVAWEEAEFETMLLGWSRRYWPTELR